MPDSHVNILDWLREQCAEYQFDVRGVFRREGPASAWPVLAHGPDDLERALVAGGHLLPLPKEPAALANVLEVSIVDFLLERVAHIPGAEVTRGTERGYPDLEIFGESFGGGFHAIDVKVAKRATNTRGRARTQSRITLYTGNTYFKWPNLHWPGTFRPFAEYATHLDIILIYTLDDSRARVNDLEIIVQEPWRIGSTKRSSTTREYIGAIDNIDDIRNGRGEFSTPEQFYTYWRKFPFKVSPQVQRQFERLVRQQEDEIVRLRRQDTQTPPDEDGVAPGTVGDA